MLIDFRKLFPKYNIKPKGVLHVGANIGEEASVYNQLGIQNVAWFEANPEIFGRLKTNIQDYPNQIAYNYAIGDMNGKTGEQARDLNGVLMEEPLLGNDRKPILDKHGNIQMVPKLIPALHVSNNGSQSSSVLELGTHKTQHPEVFYDHDTNIEFRTLNNFKFPFEMDFLNMDIQGEELRALKGMGETIQNFKWAYLEVNREELYIGCALYDDICYYLGAYGLYPVESKWVGGWGDCLFTR